MLHDEDWLSPGRLLIIEAWLENSTGLTLDLPIPPKQKGGLSIVSGGEVKESGIEVMQLERGIMQIPSDDEDDPWALVTAVRQDNGKPVVFGFVRRSSEFATKYHELQAQGR